MESDKREPILCVDDDPQVLEFLARVLRREFNVVTAPGPWEGLERLQQDGPFAVVMSDMRMPEMNGAAFLSYVCQSAPDTSRILLTGYADIESATTAINDGKIFRFLTKPCPPQTLLETIRAAAQQHRLITAERVLLERTLHGCIKALTDVLALTNPVAFGRAVRAKQYVSELAAHFQVGDKWLVEVAAMLSQIGSITLPPQTLEKVYDGQPLTEDEVAMVDRMPAIAHQVLGDIPRLEPVISIIAYQRKNFDGTGVPADRVRGEAIPWGARVLKVVLDFDDLETQGMIQPMALATLQGRQGAYDPQLLQAFAEIRGIPAPNVQIREITIREVRPGMTFAADVKTRSGRLLIARGQDVGESLAERLRNLPAATGIVEPVRVIVKRSAVK